MDGNSLKPSIDDDVKAVTRSVWTEAVRSFLRNFCCYLALSTLILLCVQGRNFMNLSIVEKVMPLLLLCIGLSGVSFQILHVWREFRSPSNRSVVGQMLCERTKQYTNFVSMIYHRQVAAPYITMEIKVRHRVNVKRANCKRQDEGHNDNVCAEKHWTQVTKCMAKMLHYNSWRDGSKPINCLQLRMDRPYWLVVAKDCRTANQKTDLSVREDVVDFSRDADFDSKKMSFKKSGFVFDVMEGERYPDVQAYLVCPDGKKSRFLTFTFYKMMLVLGLDSPYLLVFHCVTKFAGRYTIVKVIER